MTGRRQFLVAVGAACLAGPALAAEPVILVLGDSLSAEYGLKRGTGWVALLQERLAQAGITARVVNASISGDTTAGGRSRLPALLKRVKPSLVVIELGANDALRGQPARMTETNLDAMAKAARAAGAKVLLAGMRLPPNYGRSYGEQMLELYARVAQRQRAALVPFLLAGVADDPAASASLFQADRLHPNEQAQARLLANVWPELKQLISK